MKNSPIHFQTRRTLLLVEIERRCAHADCAARLRIGLTKQEAQDYHGFDCERCERWMEDALTKRDVPEWWDELRAACADDFAAEIIFDGSDDGDDAREGAAR